MTAIIPLGFDAGAEPVKVKLQSGEEFVALELDWVNLRKDWPAPNGVMLTIELPDGNQLKAFVPWWNIQYISQLEVIETPVIENAKNNKA